MEQEDGVVERHCQLQDGAHRIRDERHFAQHDVGAHVEHDGHADGRDEQHRLDPRERGEHQQKQDGGHDDGHGAQHLLHRVRLELRRVHRLARHGVRQAPAACGGVVGARLVHQAAQGGDGRAFLAFGDGHLEQRRACGFGAGRGAWRLPIGSARGRIVHAVIGLHRLLVGRLQRHGDVHDVVEPHDAFHPVDGGDFVLERKGLRHRDVVHEHVRVGNGLRELLLHDLHGRGRLRLVGQVVHHVVVGLDEGNERGAHHGRGQKSRDDRLAVPDDAVYEAIHALGSPSRRHSLHSVG